MEWNDIKIKQPDSEKEAGWYVVLINRKPHVVYFGFRNWNSPWQMPNEWQQPTHYIKLDSIKDFWSNYESMAIMD
jgi:hypothetical protein